MKQVLFILNEPLRKGGAQSVIMSIVRQLSGNVVFDIMLLNSTDGYYDEEFASYGGCILRLPVYEGKSSIRKRLDIYVRGGFIYRSCLSLLKTKKYDAVHCCNGYEAAYVLLAAKNVGVPVRIVHAHIVYNLEGKLIRKAYNSFLFKLIKYCATAYIGPSKESCVSMFGDDTNYTVIPAPYDDTRFYYDNKCKKTGKITLLQVGSFSENKNQLYTIGILSELCKQGYDAELTLVGFDTSNTYFPLLNKKISDLNLSEKVKIYPPDADIPNLMRQSTCLIFPSKRESFGIVLVEAQASGLKCFVSDTVPSDANVGGCIYFSIQRSPKEIADLIITNTLYENTNNKYDCSKFSSAVVAGRYMQIYEGVL